MSQAYFVSIWLYQIKRCYRPMECIRLCSMDSLRVQTLCYALWPVDKGSYLQTKSSLPVGNVLDSWGMHQWRPTREPHDMGSCWYPRHESSSPSYDFTLGWASRPKTWMCSLAHRPHANWYSQTCFSYYLYLHRPHFLFPFKMISHKSLRRK